MSNYPITSPFSSGSICGIVIQTLPYLFTICITHSSTESCTIFSMSKWRWKPLWQSDLKEAGYLFYFSIVNYASVHLYLVLALLLWSRCSLKVFCPIICKCSKTQLVFYNVLGNDSCFFQEDGILPTKTWLKYFWKPPNCSAGNMISSTSGILTVLQGLTYTWLPPVFHCNQKACSVDPNNLKTFSWSRFLGLYLLPVAALLFL